MSDQQIQTDFVFHIDVSTQYDLDAICIPIVDNEELLISKEIEISSRNQIEKGIDQECQTINKNLIRCNEYTETPHIYLNDCAWQPSVVPVENRSIQTDSYSSLYSSSIHIIPTYINEPYYSSKILIIPRENQSSSLSVIDQEIQCDLSSLDTIIPITIESTTKNTDRKSIIQQQMEEKEKQMNRIIGMVSQMNCKCIGRKSFHLIIKDTE